MAEVGWQVRMAVLGIIASLLMASSIAIASNEEEAQILAGCDNLSLYSDFDLANEASLNSWPGSGVVGDPYLITNCSGVIYISGTTLHFELSSSMILDLDIVSAVNAKIHNNTLLDVAVAAGSGVILVDNSFPDLPLIMFSGDNHLVFRNDFNTTSEGVVIGPAVNNLVILENTFIDIGARGIGTGFGPGSSGIQIIDNQFIRTGNGAIQMSTINDISVTGNTFTDCSLIGLVDDASIYFGGSTNLSISDNTILNSHRAGINILGGAGTLVIQGNRIESSQGSGIHVNSTWGTGGAIADNILGNNSRGIWLELSGPFPLSGNQLNNDSIFINDPWASPSNVPTSWTQNPIASDNTIDGLPVLAFYDQVSPVIPPGGGQYILHNVTDVNLDGITMTGGGEIGILISDSDQVIISGVNITGLTHAGIYTVRTSNLTLTESEIVNNGYGVRLLLPANTDIHHNRFSGNGVHATSSGGASWDDGYPSGGNWWSGFTWVDNCSGPNQTICTGSDGFWDLARAIVGGPDTDRYPYTNDSMGMGVTVQPGWNLISHLLPQPMDAEDLLDDAFDGTTTWDRIYAWESGSWLSFNRARPAFLNDAISVTVGTGLWLNITAVGDGQLWFSTGALAEVPLTIGPGWDLVGYPSATALDVTTAMGGITYSALEGQNSSAAYGFSTMGPADIMEPNRAYWINTDSAQVWSP